MVVAAAAAVVVVVVVVVVFVVVVVVVVVVVIVPAAVQEIFISCYTQIYCFVILSYKIKFFVICPDVLDNFGNIHK